MSDPTPLDFLLARRSHPPKALRAPGPDRPALETMLTAATRVPDHGALAPWRFVVLGEGACRGMGRAIRASDRPEDQREKAAGVWDVTPCCVAVIESPVESAIAPQPEQSYSAGAACAALVNAALASGWGAGWVSGWPAHDRALMTDAFALGPEERVAGFVHIGTAGAAPPDRPRPDLAAKVEWRA